jgi:hypothetical protein
MAMDIRTFRVTGKSPLLMNNGAAMRPADNTAVKTKKIPTPEEEAAAKVYKLDSGELYLPAIAFRSSLLGGCIGRKIGKRAAKTYVSAGVFSVQTECILTDPPTNKPITEYHINTMRAVVQRNGVLRSRPEITEWQVDVQLEIDRDFLTPETVLELFNLAGKLVGIGDYRPEKTGPYGRYTVELLETKG